MAILAPHLGEKGETLKTMRRPQPAHRALGQAFSWRALSLWGLPLVLSPNFSFLAPDGLHKASPANQTGMAVSGKLCACARNIAGAPWNFSGPSRPENVQPGKIGLIAANRSMAAWTAIRSVQKKLWSGPRSRVLKSCGPPAMLTAQPQFERTLDFEPWPLLNRWIGDRETTDPRPIGVCAARLEGRGLQTRPEPVAGRSTIQGLSHNTAFYLSPSFAPP